MSEALDPAPYLDPPPAPTPLDTPPGRGRVLVFAPHPDDELIGPGGTLLLHRQAGDALRIVVLTDGTRADAASVLPPDEYRQVREQESRAAARRLGAGSIEFWGFPDGARARPEDLGVLVPRLGQEIETFRPDLVYAPHPGEAHGDHHVTAVAVARALAELGHPAPCFGYEVWSACAADLVVDVTATFSEKQDIARVYESQLQHTDLIRFFTGLNTYRAVFLPKGARHGEAFVEMGRNGAGA